MASDRIWDIEIKDLYRGVDMTRNLVLNAVVQSCEGVYPVNDKLGYLPIQDRITIPRDEGNGILQGLYHYGDVYRCADCGRFEITEEVKMELRRN